MSKARFMVALVWACSAALAWAGDAAWPAAVARIEEMKLLTPLRISVPKVRERGDVKGPAVLKVHVDENGQVRRAVLMESSGSPVHDEAALHAVRAAKFSPKEIDGAPTPVTLVLPLHLPLASRPYRP